MKGIQIDDLPERYQRQARAQLAARPAWNPVTVQEHNERIALDSKSGGAQGMVCSDRPLLVRIIRIGGRRLDDDNLSGGCKEIRDAIADAFGRTGDSAKEGFIWEYEQKDSD